jgi:hypothetical protein
VAPRGGTYSKEALKRFAVAALTGVGDPSLGEWDEYGGYAFHVRRRLSIEEAATVGPVVDVRGTEDGRRRCAALRRYVLPAMWAEECHD